MPLRIPTLARRTAPVAVALGCLGTMSGTALGLEAPPGLASAPASPSQSTAWTFSWGAPAPTPGYAVSGYQVSVDGGGFADAGAGGSYPATFADGPHTFAVRALETPTDPLLPPALPGPASSITVVVDRTPPVIEAALDPARPNGGGGWYRSLRVVFTCSDNYRLASCTSPITRHDQGRGQRYTGEASDAAGLTATRRSPEFNFDGIGPRTGEPKVPTAGARIGAPPAFTWSSGGDATSGADHYDVLVRWAGRSEFVAARVGHERGRSEFSSPRTMGPELPERTSIDWRIRTYDVAGNTTTSFWRTFTIDSTVPPAPTITGGPTGFTNVNAPIFTWTGTLGAFAWAVSQAGADTPLRTGTGGTSAALAPLPDGDYTFQVTQSTANGVASDEATRSFQVDTVAPAAPTITSRPPNPTAVAQPSFAWTSEEAASFRWQVLGPGGASLQGPADTPLPSATIGVVGAGTYTFRVWQIDPAGNISAPATEPFTVTGGAATARPRARTILPRVNARRMSPRAGATLRSLRPTLSWVSGRNGVTFYNLQLFRVARRAGRAPQFKKVFTAFPRRTSVTLPAGRLRPGTCYVWRVWPYVDRRFTPKPLGISNFCVAKASQLKRPKAERGPKGKRPNRPARRHA